MLITLGVMQIPLSAIRYICIYVYITGLRFTAQIPTDNNMMSTERRTLLQQCRTNNNVLIYQFSCRLNSTTYCCSQSELTENVASQNEGTIVRKNSDYQLEVKNNVHIFLFYAILC